MYGGGGTRVHAAIQRLVAIASFLPFTATVTFDNSGYQLLCRELFEILLSIFWEMAVTRRMRTPALFRGPGEAKPAIEFLLDHRSVHRPNLHSPAHLRSLWANVHRRWLVDRCGTAGIPFYNDCPFAAKLARPSIHLWRCVTRVDCKLHDWQCRAQFGGVASFY